MTKLIAFVFLLSSTAQANIVCTAQTSMGPAKIEIAENQVKISGAALTKTQIYDHLAEEYDGHMTDLITAPGLSISFENWYGCIHNAHITANFRTPLGFIESVTAGQCSGGSTPDNICHIKG